MKRLTNNSGQEVHQPHLSPQDDGYGTTGLSTKTLPRVSTTTHQEPHSHQNSKNYTIPNNIITRMTQDPPSAPKKQKIEKPPPGYTCQVCGAEGRVRWSKTHDNMIVECSNRKCGSFIQMFLGYKCNIPMRARVPEES